MDHNNRVGFKVFVLETRQKQNHLEAAFDKVEAEFTTVKAHLERLGTLLAECRHEIRDLRERTRKL
jgi:hypothetical protein